MTGVVRVMYERALFAIMTRTSCNLLQQMDSVAFQASKNCTLGSLISIYARLFIWTPKSAKIDKFFGKNPFFSADFC